MASLRLITGGEPVPPDWDAIARVLVAHARYLGATVEQAEDLAHDVIVRFLEREDWYDPALGTPTAALRVWVTHRLQDARRHDGVVARVHALLRAWAPRWVEPAGVHEARRRRIAFLSSLAADERLLFEVWQRQRAGAWDSREAAEHLNLDQLAYEAAKKRLRRRCREILAFHGWDVDDLLDEAAR